MENAAYLFAVYSVVWVGVFGYLFYLYRKQRKLRHEIDSLKNAAGKQDRD